MSDSRSGRALTHQQSENTERAPHNLVRGQRRCSCASSAALFWLLCACSAASTARRPGRGGGQSRYKGGVDKDALLAEIAKLAPDAILNAMMAKMDTVPYTKVHAIYFGLRRTRKMTEWLTYKSLKNLSATHKEILHCSLALLFYDGKVGDHTTPGRRALLATTSELPRGDEGKNLYDFCRGSIDSLVSMGPAQWRSPAPFGDSVAVHEPRRFLVKQQEHHLDCLLTANLAPRGRVPPSGYASDTGLTCEITAFGWFL
eukprot:COSAG06_NODE_785_length_12306_cov_22.984435_4_plen_258_part_00